MNCASLRNRLLALPDPSAVSDSIAIHLQACSACHAWHRVLVQVERTVASVTVPVGNGKRKQQLIAQFRNAKAPKAKAAGSNKLKPVIEKPATKHLSQPKPSTPRIPIGERLAKAWPLGLVAAALLVGTIAWTMLSGKKDPDAYLAKAPNDPMLKEVVAAKVNLDRAHTSADRLRILAKLADTIHEEARDLSKVTPSEMSSLAAMYKQVVEEAMVIQARSLNEDERKATLPTFAKRLGDAEAEANRLAAESPVGSDRALWDIALAARTGRIELAKLIQGRST